MASARHVQYRLPSPTHASWQSEPCTSPIASCMYPSDESACVWVRYTAQVYTLGYEQAQVTQLPVAQECSLVKIPMEEDPVEPQPSPLPSPSKSLSAEAPEFIPALASPQSAKPWIGDAGEPECIVVEAQVVAEHDTPLCTPCGTPELCAYPPIQHDTSQLLHSHGAQDEPDFLAGKALESKETDTAASE